MLLFRSWNLPFLSLQPETKAPSDAPMGHVLVVKVLGFRV